jgi:hypothetical protein
VCSPVWSPVCSSPRSGECPVRRQKVRREQLRQHPGVDLVGLTLASPIARVFIGFDTTTTRAPRGASNAATAPLLPVACNATSSSGRQKITHP